MNRSLRHIIHSHKLFPEMLFKKGKIMEKNDSTTG